MALNLQYGRFAQSIGLVLHYRWYEAVRFCQCKVHDACLYVRPWINRFYIPKMSFDTYVISLVSYIYFQTQLKSFTNNVETSLDNMIMFTELRYTSCYTRMLYAVQW